MKLRIVGCTKEQLAQCSPYLSLGVEYSAEKEWNHCWNIKDDEGDEIAVIVGADCAHLPDGARWREVPQ